MPFAGYKDFAQCVKKARGKKNPKAYCGAIKHRTEDRDLEPLKERAAHARMKRGVQKT